MFDDPIDFSNDIIGRTEADLLAFGEIAQGVVGAIRAAEGTATPDNDAEGAVCLVDPAFPLEQGVHGQLVKSALERGEGGAIDIVCGCWAGDG